ncbi:MAG: ribosome maturation factor RimM, partial [Nitrospinota bacterium]
WEDLIGLDVVDETGETVGRLEEIFASGPKGECEVIVVRREGSDELLLPMTREVVLEVDLEGGRMRVSVPAGLEETGRTDG